MRVSTLHSVVGGNDGVSIIIKQMICSLSNNLSIPLSQFSFVCGKNDGGLPGDPFVLENRVFWHKDDAIGFALSHFDNSCTDMLLLECKSRIETAIRDAMDTLNVLINEINPDVIVSHNTAHPPNLVAAVALSRLLPKLSNRPAHIIWWHDSFLERTRFINPNTLLKQYIAEAMRSTHIHGLVFINSTQKDVARIVGLAEKPSVVIRNTCEPVIVSEKKNSSLLSPPLDPYNKDFLSTVGIPEGSIIVLQHTRIVQRKRIDTALDFSFSLALLLGKEVFLLVSGPDGDEPQHDTMSFLRNYYSDKKRNASSSSPKVHLIFAAEHIKSSREVENGKKYFAFDEVPSIVAFYGGIGVFFSDFEGFGNNLLELIAGGCPTAAREYSVFVSDVLPFGFDIPTSKDGEISQVLVERMSEMITDIEKRNRVVEHNIDVLKKHFSHKHITTQFSSLLRECGVRKK